MPCASLRAKSERWFTSAEVITNCRLYKDEFSNYFIRSKKRLINWISEKYWGRALSITKNGDRNHHDIAPNPHALFLDLIEKN